MSMFLGVKHSRIYIENDEDTVIEVLKRQAAARDEFERSKNAETPDDVEYDDSNDLKYFRVELKNGVPVVGNKPVKLTTKRVTKPVDEDTLS